MTKTERFISEVARMQTAAFKTNNPSFNKAVVKAASDIGKAMKEGKFTGNIEVELKRRIQCAAVQHLYKNVKAADGTTISYNGELKPGTEVWVVSTEAKNPLPAPDGTVKLADGTVITVASGKVAKIEKPTSLKTTATPLHDALQLLAKSQKQPSLKTTSKLRNVIKSTFGKSKIQDGSTLEWNGELKQGTEIKVQVEGGKKDSLIVPAGVYVLADGTQIEVDAVGKVAKIGARQPTMPTTTTPGIPSEESEAVADTALNGAQISGMLDIVEKAAAQGIPIDAASELLRAAFPTVSVDLINKVIDSLKGFKPIVAAGGKTFSRIRENKEQAQNLLRQNFGAKTNGMSRKDFTVLVQTGRTPQEIAASKKMDDWRGKYMR